MYSDDLLQSDTVSEIFEQALHEEGVENAEVSHTTNGFSDEFYVHKTVGSEKIAYKTAVSFQEEELDPVKIRKQIAREAEEVAKAFREKLVDTFDWDGRVIEVSVIDGAWAECQSCGSRVELSRLPRAAFSADAELSTPKPIPQEIESVLDALSDYERTLTKLYLIGKLRHECNPSCRNSRYNTVGLPPAHIERLT